MKLKFDLLEDRSVPAIFTWCYTGTGYGNWNEASNWVNNAVPTATDDIYIPANTGSITIGLPAVNDLVINVGWNKQFLSAHNFNVNGLATVADAEFRFGEDFAFVDSASITDCDFIGYSQDEQTLVLATEGITYLYGDVAVDVDTVVNQWQIDFNAHGTSLIKVTNATKACILSNEGTIYAGRNGHDAYCELNTKNYVRMLFESQEGELSVIGWSGWVKNYGDIILVGPVHYYVTGRFVIINAYLDYVNIYNYSGGSYNVGNLLLGTSSELRVPDGLYSAADCWIGTFVDNEGGTEAYIDGDVYIRKSLLTLDYYDVSIDPLINGSGWVYNGLDINGTLYIQDAALWFNFDFNAAFGFGRANHLTANQIWFYGNHESTINFKTVVGTPHNGTWWTMKSDEIIVENPDFFMNVPPAFDGVYKTGGTNAYIGVYINSIIPPEEESGT